MFAPGSALVRQRGLRKHDEVMKCINIARLNRQARRSLQIHFSNRRPTAGWPAKALGAIALVALITLSALGDNRSAAESSALVQYAVPRLDGTGISYYLAANTGDNKQPILLIIHGSDCNSIANHPRIRRFERVATDAVALYVDKYGITTELPWSESDDRNDCPDVHLERNTLNQRVLDILRVVGELRQTAHWWDGKLFIVGGSEGAIVAESVAPLVPETQSLIIFGFGGRWFENDVLHSVQVSLNADGESPQAQAKRLKTVRDLLAGALRDRDAAKNLWGYSHAWWASMLEFDQLEALRRVHVPVLALQGSEDEFVDVAGAREMMGELRLQGSNITFLEYDGLNHGFRDAENRSRLDRVIDDMAKWLGDVRQRRLGR
jgi:pimeloyl-ACP methyl ester carboxylesterase